MAWVEVDTLESSTWTVMDSTAVTALLSSESPYTGTQFMQVIAASEGSAGPVGVHKTIAEGIDLSNVNELRFALRADVRGVGNSEEEPVYLRFGFGEGSYTTNMYSVEVRATDVWELHRIWLADIPKAVRKRVKHFALLFDENVALDYTVDLDSVWGCTTEAVRDIEEALKEKLLGVCSNVVIGFPAEEYKQVRDASFPGASITLLEIRPDLVRTQGHSYIDNYRSGTPKTVERWQAPIPYVFVFQVDLYSRSLAQDSLLMQNFMQVFPPTFSFISVHGEALDVTHQGFTQLDSAAAGERLFRKTFTLNVYGLQENMAPETQPIVETPRVNVSQM